MIRDDIIRMAREAGFVTGTRDHADGSDSMPFVQSVATRSCLHELERFADLVAYHTRVHNTSPMVIDAKSLDPDVLKRMLDEAAPMPIVPMPPSDEVAAAVAAEREACAKLCDARKDQSRNHLVRSGLAVAALDIRARGTP